MLSPVNLRHQVFQNPHFFLAFGFGSGLMQFAPGTWGTLAAIPLYLLISQCSALTYALICLAGFGYGIWACAQVTEVLGVHDYKGIVWDEVIGFFISMAFIPISLTAIVLGFLLFRFFDILKPPPIHWVDKHVSGGFGIMFDDVLAGLMAGIILWALHAGGLL